MSEENNIPALQISRQSHNQKSSVMTTPISLREQNNSTFGMYCKELLYAIVEAD